MQNLLVARLVLEWTQQGLADAAGLSRATIAQLEGGTGDPKLSTVELLARALGISPLLLLMGAEELEGLIRFSQRDWPARILHHPSVQTMKHLQATGFLRSRLEAANIGVHFARQAIGNVPGPGGTLGAAIGSFHLPGAGTLAGAEVGRFLDDSERASRQERVEGPIAPAVFEREERLRRQTGT